MKPLAKHRCSTCGRTIPGELAGITWPEITEPVANREIARRLGIPSRLVNAHYRRLGHQVLPDGGEYEAHRAGKVLIQRYLTIHPLPTEGAP